MANKGLNKGILLVVILILLLVVALSYIGFNEYSNYRVQKDVGLYQQGAQYGYEQAVSIIYQQALSCQQVPLTMDNKTISLIASECLQATQQTAAQ